MSWLSDAFRKIEKEVIRPVAHTVSEAYDDVEDEIKRSEIAQAALIAGTAGLAAPVVLPVLGGAVAGAGSLASGAVSGAGTLASGAIEGTGSILGGLWNGIANIFAPKTALPYLTDAELAAGLQPSAGMSWTSSGLPYLAESQLPSALQIAESGGLGNILSGVVKAVPGAIETLANVLPSIETIFGGDESAGPIPQSTSPTSTQPIILQTGAGQTTGAAQPVFYQTPAAEGGSPNMMLYIGIAVIAYFLLR